MQDPIKFYNFTSKNSEYINQKKLLVFSSSSQRYTFAGGTVLMIAAILFAFSRMGWIALLLLFVGIGLCWFFPGKSLRQMFSVDGPQQVEFDSNGFLIGETRYLYNRLTRIRLVEQWLILEFPQKSFILDAKCFEGITCEAFISFLREEYPQIPVKRSSSSSALRRMLPLLAVTFMGILMTTIGLFVGQSKHELPEPFQNTPVSSVNHLTEEPSFAAIPDVSESYITNDSRLLADPLKTADFDYFTMCIPERLYLYKIQEEDTGKVSISYRKISEGLLLLVEFVPKNILEESSLLEVAETCKRNFNCPDDPSISAMGNYCMEITDIDVGSAYVSGYVFCMDAEYYYATIAMCCIEESFEDYLPHFKKWEQTIIFNDPPTGEILSYFAEEQVGQKPVP